ncbi:hypothetical protein Plim_1124 [Planctopirus limnophila DSM 3776]|uniref:Uncharacterized protein n=1 Tax=Planctopirus limnophila (strain ATCC 43296 / DSM 3776 / IFAM 1008 / Mu 290) TaxID=521674 RepID=D5STX4_PLAL2|nr:hypothetical protein Plim_1124 [Planctopirus limnophila DSM 3776]
MRLFSGGFVWGGMDDGADGHEPECVTRTKPIKHHGGRWVVECKPQGGTGCSVYQRAGSVNDGHSKEIKEI